MAKTWLPSALTALALGGAAMAQDTPASDTIEAAQASIACAPALAAGARCSVEGSTRLSPTLQWAFYEVAGPGGRRGISVLLTPAADPARLKVAASLTVSAAALERWKRIAYAPAGVVKHAGAEYAGMAVRGDNGLEAFSLHRLEADGRLTAVEAARVPAEVQAKVVALTGPGCRVTSGGMDWRLFRVRQGVGGDNGSCGTVMIDLAVEEGAVKIADALAIR